ncbi:sodium:calcium antiporter [Candidatus Woesearchaeota archaeon]|nr:MAG: sodium:calcium antiporter [Candidatus Woesearchaeota archaeon]
MLLQQLAIFAISCSLLVFSGSLLVRSLVRVGGFLNISGFMLSFIIMAFSTSLPELLVGIRSAMMGSPALALGNIIGSNVADVTLVAGITALLSKGFRTTPLVRKNAYAMVAIVGIATALTYIGDGLSRIDAIVLLAILCVHTYALYKHKDHEKPLNNHYSKWELVSAAGIIPVTIAVLMLSADFVVQSGITLAGELALPVLFVGLFFIAIGTSLPELAFEARAALARRDDIAMGDLIGSLVVNSTLILATVALISPFSPGKLFYISSFFMLTVCLLFAVMCESYNQITWKEGIVLLMMYALFIMVEFTVQGLTIHTTPL